MARKKNGIAPGAETAVMAMDRQRKAVEKAGELYGDGQPFDEGRVLDCIVFKAERSSQELYELGKYCLWYKAVAGHGRFLEGLRRRDINITAANWAMLMVEKFGDKFCTVQNLGTRKARLLTTFSKEEIDAYANGGPLGSIPHDDVSGMPVRELEAETRRLRKTVDGMKESHKRAMQQKEAKICELEDLLHDKPPPTKEQLAAVRLEPLRKKLFGHLLQARHNLDEAVNAAAEAQRVEGATFPQLQEWGRAHYEQLAPIGDLFEELDQALNNCAPDKPKEEE
jgi:hypothetical protein